MRRLLIALLVSLAVPASATAAVSTIGTGARPNVVVDASGTAYIAWIDSASALHFCRLPRGASACAVNTTIPSAGQTLYRPFLRVSGSVVNLINARYGFTTGSFDQVYEFTSTDGGATFGAPAPVGTSVFEQAAFGPGGAMLTATNADSGGGAVQYMPLAGQVTARAVLFPTTYLYDGAVDFINGSPTAIAVFTDASSNAVFRVFQGGDYNSDAAWNPASPIGFGAYPRLADGPKGLFLLTSAQPNGFQVRRWNGGGFVNSATLAEGAEPAQADLYQDAGGRLHIVWPRFEADGIHLFHAVSDDGSTWSSGTVTSQQGDEEDDLRVAAAADHIGVVVWRDSQTSAIKVAPIGPGPPPVFHQSVSVSRVSGTVRVKKPGAKGFTTLSGSDSVPLGSTVDVKKGRIALSSVPKKGGNVETAQFYSGIFKVTQPGSITQLALNEALSCRGARSASAAAKKKPKTRKLWGSGSGSFRTRGQYSSATVRGTTWLVQDSCGKTLTRVTRGVVAVQDLVKHKTIVLRAGKSYTARAKR